MSSYLGIDLGGTHLRAVLVTPGGEVLDRAKEVVRSRDDNEGVLDQIVEIIQRFQAFVSGHRELRTVGIGAPGFLYRDRGVIAASPHFPQWRDFPLRELLEARTGLTVVLENDANAAAWGEKWLGAGQDLQTFVLLTLGTGVGGGIVLEDRLWRGQDGMAGEVGHLTVYPDGPPCDCGSSGCLEVYASATGMVRRAILALEGGRESMLTEQSEGNFYKITAEGVYLAARDGDGLAREILREAGQALGIAISGVLRLFNPQAVLLGGGVSAAWDLLEEAVQKEVLRRVHPEALALRTSILRGLLGEEAGVLGAAKLAMDAAMARSVA
jgi:glucokinase